jgi:hypothetical protein
MVERRICVRYQFVGLRERSKRDCSAAQAACFAGAKQKENAPACFGRSDWSRACGVGIAKGNC